MAKSKTRTKVAIVVIAVVVIAIASYALFPYVASTKITDLQNDQTAYVYGTVGSRVSIGNFNAFNITDGSGSIIVIWNGTLPSPGTKVLVHGNVHEYSILFSKYRVVDASTVYPWLF